MRFVVQLHPTWLVWARTNPQSNGMRLILLQHRLLLHHLKLGAFGRGTDFLSSCLHVWCLPLLSPGSSTSTFLAEHEMFYRQKIVSLAAHTALATPQNLWKKLCERNYIASQQKLILFRVSSFALHKESDRAKSHIKYESDMNVKHTKLHHLVRQINLLWACYLCNLV